MYKTLRADKSATAEPPAGYHYEGQRARMIDGKLTVRLRRDVEGSRNEIYNDPFYAETELTEANKVKSAKYICCVSGCTKSVSMFVKDMCSRFFASTSLNSIQNIFLKMTYLRVLLNVQVLLL